MKFCQYQDCNEKAVVTIGRFGANTCFKHAVDYQKVVKQK